MCERHLKLTSQLAGTACAMESPVLFDKIDGAVGNKKTQKGKKTTTWVFGLESQRPNRSWPPIPKVLQRILSAIANSLQ